MQTPKENPNKLLDVLIPGHLALKESEKQLGLDFVRWFRRCAKTPQLQELAQYAADMRGDRVKCLKALRELALQSGGSNDDIRMLTRMAKIKPNAFLIITAKLQEIVETYAREQEKSEGNDKETKKIRIDVSEKVKRTL